MHTIRNWSAVTAVLTTIGSVVVGASIASAQAVKSTHIVVNGRRGLTETCASLISGPSELVRTPEGKAVLRLKRELDGVSMIVSQRGATADGIDARRLSEMQRGVDSIMHVVVRYANPDGSLGPAITVTRADSLPMVVNGKTLNGRLLVESMDGPMRAARPEFEKLFLSLRALEPQVAEMARSVASNGAPSGYLGLSLSGSQIRLVTDSGSFTSHCDYPMIEAVDVPSPARAAGLLAGDTVIAYNGRDVMAQAVNYPQLLVPGKVVRIKVRREGKVKEMPVTVESRPQELTERFMFQTPRPGMPLLPPPDAPVSGNMVFRFSPSAGVIAANATSAQMLGAQLNAMDDEFAQSLGVEPGLLVMKVQSGSPAAEAGLKPGEVIRTVNGTAVREIAAMRRAIAVPGAHEVKLTVSARDAAPRVVTIRF